jgi:hypothetical protein
MDKHFLSCSIKKLKEEENPQKLMQETQWHHSEREEEESDTRTSAPNKKNKKKNTEVACPESHAIRGPEWPVSIQKGIKHITGNENFTKRNNWDPN